MINFRLRTIRFRVSDKSIKLTFGRSRLLKVRSNGILLDTLEMFNGHIEGLPTTRDILTIRTNEQLGTLGIAGTQQNSNYTYLDLNKYSIIVIDTDTVEMTKELERYILKDMSRITSKVYWLLVGTNATRVTKRGASSFLNTHWNSASNRLEVWNTLSKHCESDLDFL